MAKRAWLSVAVMLWLVVWSLPGLGCVSPVPPTIGELQPGQPIEGLRDGVVLGVYEQHHIAGAPNLLVFVDDRTVSVVTRYWGEPPAHTGLQRHGDSDILGSTSCGNRAGRVGDYGYMYVTEGNQSDQSRGLGLIQVGPPDPETLGQLTQAEEDVLSAGFGEPTSVANPSSTRMLGILLAWQWHITLTVLIVGLTAWRIRRRRLRTDTTATRT